MSLWPDCEHHTCQDVVANSFVAPDAAIAPESVRAVLISECAPADAADWYYAAGDPLFARTTIQAFRDAGADVSSIADIVSLGFYLTCAVKCPKTGTGLSAATIERCSHLLEQEIASFTQAQAWLLMGDVAIRAINCIAKRESGARAIPAGSTYKIRSGEYSLRGGRAFPSYLQAGPAFFVEKSKRQMIAEDLKAALGILRR